MQLKIQNLTIGYEQKPVLSDINLSAQSSEIIALIGKNGVGKSTFLKTLAGILPELSGQIFLDNIDLLNLKPKERARFISIVLTDNVDVPMPVNEFLLLGRQPYTNMWGSISENDKQVVREVSEMLQIEALMDRKISELSDGERQKVLVARALAQETPVILMDEPTTHLDLENKAILINNLLKVSKIKNKIIILSTHDINLVLPKANKIWMTGNSIREIDSLIELKTMFQSGILNYDPDCKIFKLT